LSESWPAPVRWIHWTSAVLLALTVPAALFAQALAETWTDAAEALISGHILAGLSLLVLTTARISARVVFARPSPLPGPVWLRVARGLRSAAFYALLCAIPVTGILKLTLSGLDVSAFGVTLLPAGVPVLPLARASSRTHEVLAYVLIALALLHAGAALLGRRAALGRMWRTKRVSSSRRDKCPG
jgi:cytochrome b561